MTVMELLQVISRLNKSDRKMLVLKTQNILDQQRGMRIDFDALFPMNYLEVKYAV